MYAQNSTGIALVTYKEWIIVDVICVKDTGIANVHPRNRLTLIPPSAPTK